MGASWNSGVLCSRSAGLIERVSRLLVNFIERFAPSAIAAGTCDKIADKTTSKRRGRECCYSGGDNGNGEQSTDLFHDILHGLSLVDRSKATRRRISLGDAAAYEVAH
jgi:hypothetical protein